MASTRHVTLDTSNNPKVTFKLQVTFRLVDEKSIKLANLHWPSTKPLRRCITRLQEKYGSDTVDVGLRVRGKNSQP